MLYLPIAIIVFIITLVGLPTVCKITNEEVDWYPIIVASIFAGALWPGVLMFGILVGIIWLLRVGADKLSTYLADTIKNNPIKIKIKMGDN